MRPAGIFFVLLFLTGRLSAQQVNGKVSDRATKLPVSYATITSKAAIGFTAADGSFSVTVLNNDTIRITHMGYKTYKIAASLIPTIIYLEPDSVLLNVVTIKGIRNYKRDSLSNRREFAKVFAYKASALKDIFIGRSQYANTNRPNNTSELVSINVLQVISLLSKNKMPQSKLQKNLLRDEEDSYVYRIFSKERVTDLTGLKGDSLQDFMFKYRPPIGEVKKMTAYDMIIYIKKKYAIYTVMPLKKETFIS